MNSWSVALGNRWCVMCSWPKNLYVKKDSEIAAIYSSETISIRRIKY